jgi:hypothetical protein
MSERFVQNKEIIQSSIANEVVMMDVESGFYFGLNSVGSIIWSLLGSPITFDELINKLMEQFQVDRVTCEADTQNFIQQLLEKNIIRKE